MTSLFEGNPIRRLKPQGGLVAGKQKWYELHNCGGVVLVKKKQDVDLIDKILKEFRRLKNKGILKPDDEMDYLTDRLMEEGW